jgi:hypothetical protein
VSIGWSLFSDPTNGTLTPHPNSLTELARALARQSPAAPKNSPAGLLDVGAFSHIASFGSLASLSPLCRPPLRPAQIKRKAFFSFQYRDAMRVNNVRNAWCIDNRDAPGMRSFYDSSLWEKRQLTSPEAIKNIIRAGVKYTSVVCVLVGSETWSSRWVKYEIARAVVDERGLLAVHINGLKHVERLQADPLGLNPLQFMGIYKSSIGTFYLYERRPIIVDRLTGLVEWHWFQYPDYTQPVPLPRYLAEPSVGYVMPLAWHTDEYDYVAGIGHKNIGAWFDGAAQQAGR